VRVCGQGSMLGESRLRAWQSRGSGRGSRWKRKRGSVADGEDSGAGGGKEGAGPPAGKRGAAAGRGPGLQLNPPMTWIHGVAA
jgi:hypothetical protein